MIRKRTRLKNKDLIKLSVWALEQNDYCSSGGSHDLLPDLNNRKICNLFAVNSDDCIANTAVSIKITRASGNDTLDHNRCSSFPAVVLAKIITEIYSIE